MDNDPTSQQPGGNPEEKQGETGAEPVGGGMSSASGDMGAPGDMGSMGGQGDMGAQPMSGSETQDMGTGGAAYTRPMAGSEAPDMGGAYTQPMAGSMPPASAGGYTPPPQSGQYASSPPPPGGYNPPPPGGSMPPPGGSYMPPPPPYPPGVTGGMAAPQTGMGHLFQSYMNAVTKPSAATYEAEIPNASWQKVLVGVAIVAVVGFVFSFLAASAATSSIDSAISQLQTQGGSEGLISFLQSIRGSVGGAGPVGSLIGPFISFILGAGLLYLMAKMLGGQGRDFMTHSYLLSLSYTPLRAVAAIINIVPIIGGLIGLVLTIYQIYSAGLAMQASQRMAPGRAQLAAFLPWVAGILLGCLCIVLAIFGLAAAITSGNP